MDRGRATPVSPKRAKDQHTRRKRELTRTHTPAPSRRSEGALRKRRIPLPWGGNHEFRILSIDGGGIRGVFPATFLAGLEKSYLGDSSIASCFDLIVGTSTGGIIALGLAAGLPASDMRDLYVQRGHEIFPPVKEGVRGATGQYLRKGIHLLKYRYDGAALRAILAEVF